MHVLEAERGDESSAEIAVAGSRAFHSIEKYVSSFLSLMSKKAAGTRAKSQNTILSEQLVVVTKAVNDLAVKIESIRTQEVKNLVRENLAPGLTECIQHFNEAVVAFERLEVAFNISSRDERRKLEKDFRELERGYRGGEMIADTLMRILDVLEPTPEDFLADELAKRYGDRTQEVLSAFDRIGKVGSITAEQFKDRYSKG